MTSTISRADLAAYMDMIFGYVESDEVCIALRGVPEKGTPKEGTPPDVAIEPLTTFAVDRILGHMQRWGAHAMAAFIVPAAVSAKALEDRHATEDRMVQFTTMLVDIDKGDTKSALAHATKHIGIPSMTVHSGGTTETGDPKLHVYWRLSEASDQIERIAAARKVLALKLGGDPSFGRSTQVIRIPGSIYGKGGIAKPCTIAAQSVVEYELDEILEAVDAMPLAQGVVISDLAKLTTPLLSGVPYASGKGLNFSAFKEARGDLDDRPDIKQSLVATISEGGDEDRNRWSEFNRVAGHYLHTARIGGMSLDEAKNAALGWVAANMKPAWPPVRVEAEWKALLAHDIKAKGPMPTPTAPLGSLGKSQIIDVTPNGLGEFSEPPKLETWEVANWTAGEKPKRRFMVDGLVMAGKAHMLAAEGGAGKTFLLLDLALKVALHQPGADQQWCGLPLTDIAGGTVVMFTTEDDKDELHIRLTDIDPENRRRYAKKLIIIPTINIGGAFPLVERNRATGSASLGATWFEWIKQLRAVHALNPGDLKLVIIDTLNTTLHGEENNATVINEYVQAASAVICGELGAALIVTHHVRKPGEKSKIYSPEDMKNSIRGSTALIGAFRVVLGVWHAPDYKERLASIGQDERRGLLYNFAVVKANNPQMYFDTRTMLRQPSGLLLDITDAEKKMAAATLGQHEAWMVKAVEYAAEQGHPFTIKAAMKKPPNGRKHQLPGMIQSMTEVAIDNLCKRLIAEGRIRQCNPAGAKTYNFLDIPTGPLAKGVGLDGGAYKTMEGADFTPPSWEFKFAYHAAEQRIVARGEETSRTVGSQKKEGASDAPRGLRGNPNFRPESGQS